MKINDPLLQIDVTLNVYVAATAAAAAAAAAFVLRRDASKSLSTDHAADERTFGVTATKPTLADEGDDA